MSGIVSVKNYSAPGINRREILRYAGGGSGNAEISSLLDECISEVSGKISCRVCYVKSDITVNENAVDFGFAKAESSALAKNLYGCSEAVIFAATIGLETDRLIARYGRISPAKALMFQAIGAERIESLCNVFSDEIKEYARASGLDTRPRFSPGYGDLPVDFQKDIFLILDCPRKIGLTLNDSYLMSPSKSVTAIIGIGCTGGEEKSKCSKCENVNCVFRGV